MFLTRLGDMRSNCTVIKDKLTTEYGHQIFHTTKVSSASRYSRSVSPQLCFLPNCLQTLEIQRVNTQTYKRFSTQKYDESQAGRRFLLAQVNAMI